jgi:hypothetical protein
MLIVYFFIWSYPTFAVRYSKSDVNRIAAGPRLSDPNDFVQKFEKIDKKGLNETLIPVHRLHRTLATPSPNRALLAGRLTSLTIKITKSRFQNFYEIEFLIIIYFLVPYVKLSYKVEFLSIRP